MKKILLLIFLLSVLAGCAKGNDLTSLPTASNTQTTQITGPTTSTQSIATPTSIMPTATQETQNSCSIPADTLAGKIVYYEPSAGLDFYDLTDREKNTIPSTSDTYPTLVATSPDHTRIAYFDFQSTTGWIISANGNRTEVNFDGRIDGIFYGWLGNDTIIFVDRSRSDGSVITFDVDNGAINKIVTGLQDLFTLGPNRWYAGGDQPTVIFDQTLSRVIYLSGELPDEKPGKWGFIIRNMKSQDVLWSRISSDWGVQPKWSPDAEYAAIVITDENQTNDQIYIVNRDGQEIRTVNTNIIGVDSIEWSPDGTKISYTGKALLGIYDLASNQLQQHQLHEQAATIVWSPNGNHIVVKSFVIDVLNNCMLGLSPDIQFDPLAWLVLMP